MSAYPFGRLLRIRILRAETARAATAQRRLHVVETERSAALAEEAWSKYRRQRPEREAALFKEIRGRAVTRQEMDRYHEARATLTARELELENAAKQADRNVEEAREALDKARTVLLEADRQVRKFEEDRRLWDEEQRRAVEASAESEQEDHPAFTGRFHEAYDPGAG